MNRNQYWLLAICIVSFTMFLGACNKSSSTTSDTTSGNWMKKSEYNGSIRSGAVVFVINNIAYVGTGFNGTNKLSDFYKYDATADSWYDVAPLPGTPRSSAVAFTVNGKGYVVGGVDLVGNLLDEVWEYDPATNTWTAKKKFSDFVSPDKAPVPRFDAVGFGIGNYGYLSSGFDNSNYMKDTWQYDPAADKWTEIPTYQGDKRRGAVAFVYNDQAYLATGYNNGQVVTDFFKFNPASTAANKWTPLSKITNIPDSSYNSDYTDIARQNAVAFVIGTGDDARAYISTGDNVGAPTSKTWEYNFKSDRWTKKSDFENTPRTRAIGFSINNRGFAGLGQSSTLYLSNFFEFNPNQTKVDGD